MLQSKTFCKRSIGWALFGVNFRPLQVMGGGRIFDTGPFFTRLRYMHTFIHQINIHIPMLHTHIIIHTHILSHAVLHISHFFPFQENSSPAILLAFADGVIEIHHLNTPSEPNRDQQLLSYFDNLV